MTLRELWAAYANSHVDVRKLCVALGICYSQDAFANELVAADEE